MDSGCARLRRQITTGLARVLIFCLLLLPGAGLLAQAAEETPAPQMPSGFMINPEKGEVATPEQVQGFVPDVPPANADEPAEQEAPLLGKEIIPFWHNTRLYTAGLLLPNVTAVRETIPFGYNLLFGYEAAPTNPWYPELRTELGLLHFPAAPNSVLGMNWALGLVWLVPAKYVAGGVPGSLQVALLPGAAWLRIEDRIEVVSALKFQFQVVTGYEIEVQRRLALFAQLRYSYLYDPAVPFHSTGLAVGVSYHFMAQLRKGSGS